MKFISIILILFPLFASANMNITCKSASEDISYEVNINEVQVQGLQMTYMKVTRTNLDFEPELVSIFEGFATKQYFKGSKRVTYILLDEIPTDLLGSGVSITYDTSGIEKTYLNNGAELIYCTEL